MLRSLLLVPALCALSACTPAQMGQQAPQTTTDTSVPLSSGGPCAPGYTRPDFAALERDLTAARARWTAAGVRDYSYDFAQIAAPVAFPDVRVTVRGGAVQGVTLKAGQTGEPGGQARATVEDRFAAIAQTLRGQQGQKCPVVETEYDPRDGHPTRLYSGSREVNLADGWGEWRIMNFTRP
ncbi:hypothetical protein DEIPH_ctg030orf0003 [Deinococcus phoenicis]|uniref:Lipoprotein n=1 Tax=Deinococcus phoenicis TaxID=1476583 RepID=A0A016QPZ9_9DEIO|nr:DUF6174 domain-containing protein [Deinococcus phoenicis]EYB67967.1 hypothetical protein DEIPH_ctg030orf0003 [Deinococcus phoenicis]